MRKFQFDPDEQVQSVIRLVLEQFATLGSLSGLLRHLRQQQIELPFRLPSGPQPRAIALASTTAGNLAQACCVRPAYAGAYTWGRRVHRSATPGARPPRLRPGRDRTAVLYGVPARQSRRLHHPGSNIRGTSTGSSQQRMRGPAPRPGRGRPWPLLAGLVVCGSCGCRMQTHYTPDLALRLSAPSPGLRHSPPARVSVGQPLEQLVAEQILEVVTPASLELSLRAVAEYQRERAALEKQWQLRLERAHQDTARVLSAVQRRGA